MVGSGSIARCRVTSAEASICEACSLHLSSTVAHTHTHTLMPSGAFAHHMVWGAGSVRILAVP